MGMLLADGFEDAFIGVAVRNGAECAVYDRDKCIKILIERDGMTEDEALDYFEYNVIGSLSDEVDGVMPAFFRSTTLEEAKAQAAEELEEDLSHDDDSDMN